ncbi:MAG: 3-phosphoshikimate 1-carboxyvinyltransferase [Anaerolineae bacterium]|jgi:3-phosphoshikimate 1-carboxyvinyltransferase|nr:3-phosphoshikimate 1-carboxyvinyltransferase [Anaerolineae bacterium]MBT7072136.1 3-phosphoshikimate 1-carboxyvinyltransferase [Anaerolineae bacterium]MBT7326785.1 3-phosphoshikimate 1-carboxyvinyltransferase [Anaerolineae bacterium]
MTKKITPITHPLNASVRVPGSKSLTNRALLIAALAEGKTTLTNALFSDDSRYFANALKALGFEVSVNEEEKTMSVVGLGGKIPADSAELFIGNAGTAARFLTAFLNLGNGEYILDGEPRMRERPIGDLVDALTPLGADISSPCSDDFSRPARNEKGLKPLLQGKRENYLPLKLTASRFTGGKTQIAGNVSSQYLSALLMTAPYAENPVEIEITTELFSKPYVDMTINIMQDFGIEIERDGYQYFKVSPNAYFPISNYQIESDASAASYFFTAPAICGGTVRVENISRNSVQGDIDFLDVLAEMGCTIEETENCILVTGNSSLRGVDVDMSDIPDTAQTLAAIAPFASSPTRIRGIASARMKETDRISAVCTELMKLGVKVEEYEDGMTIYPCENIQPASIETYNDHRMAMAFSLIGLRAEGVEIEAPGCVSKTFPNYFDVLDELR